ncbi:MAG TPA: Uma2 family endonuclease [Chloroflexia bacterium]|nr:Uma2 family endonuclease [Chloroflexia bacterium]
MSSVTQRLLTAQEFWQLPNSEHLELVRGKVRETMPPGWKHGVIAGTVWGLLSHWARQLAGGLVAVKAGFMLKRNPNTLRAPDVSYVRADRVPQGDVPEGFGTLAPDLAVEVISPSETADEIQEKVGDFLSAGTPLVWVIYPRRGEVVVYTADGLARTYSGDDVLEQPEVLPGFSCRVSELFA